MCIYCEFCNECVKDYDYLIDLIGNYHYVYIRIDKNKIKLINEDGMCYDCLKSLKKYKVDTSTKKKLEKILKQDLNYEKYFSMEDIEDDASFYILPSKCKKEKTISYYDI